MINYENYEYANIYHAINNFCTIDLSAFYLDFAKDVLYIEAKDQSDRRAIQTVLYESLMTLIKLVAPILSHTADEVWSFIPSVQEESVQLTDFPEEKELANAKELLVKWSKFMNVRDEVLKALEEARNEKVIGKSLTAKISLYVKDETKVLLDSIHENLQQIFIVSEFEVAGSFNEAPEQAIKLEHAAIVVTKAEGETCERCWTVTTHVGEKEDHPTLCPRCADVVNNHYSHLV